MRLGFLWLAGVRDLQWRRRRFVIAVVGSSLVFAITLMLSGYSRSFDTEVSRTLDAIGADGYVVMADKPGPFTGATPVPTERVDDVRAAAGVTAAHPIVTALLASDQRQSPAVYVIGAEPKGLGAPDPAQGRAPQARGEAVVDAKAKVALGEQFEINGIPFRAVGTTSGLTTNGGKPVVFTLLADAQELVYSGKPLATTIAVEGEPETLPADLESVGRGYGAKDLKQPMQEAAKSMATFKIMLWVVAAAIIGSVTYLSALERVGDFAVFKAIGTTTSDLLAALVMQAVVLSIAASLMSMVVARFLTPFFPTKILFPAATLATLPVVALVIGLLASAAALRRAISVDPALAFGGH